MTAARRLLPWVSAGLAVVALTVVIAALPWLWDSDPAATVLRTRYPERGVDPATLDALRAELDLPTNPVGGALGWLGGVLTGDLGTSWVSRGPVAPGVLAAIGVSLTLAAAAALVAAVVALGLLAPGVARAARRGSGDSGRGTAVAASVLGAVPEIALGAVLAVAVVAVGVGPAAQHGVLRPGAPRAPGARARPARRRPARADAVVGDGVGAGRAVGAHVALVGHAAGDDRARRRPGGGWPRRRPRSRCWSSACSAAPSPSSSSSASPASARPRSTPCSPRTCRSPRPP